MSTDPLDSLEDAFHRTPRCAVHAEREARRAPCSRCGSYACEECFGTPRETLCESCRGRVGAAIAWEVEDGGHVLARFWSTVVQALPAPVATFEGVRDGEGLLSAVWFATLANVVSYGIPMLLCAPCMLGAFALLPVDREIPRGVLLGIGMASLVAFPTFMAVFSVVLSLFVGLAYHLGALVAGGAASLVSSLRAALFLNVLAPVSAASWVLGRIPILGMLVTLVTVVGTLVWQTLALAGHARGAHGITDGRAWLVGAIPALLTVTMMAGMIVLVLALALADGNGFLEDID